MPGATWFKEMQLTEDTNVGVSTGADTGMNVVMGADMAVGADFMGAVAICHGLVFLVCGW